MLMVIRRATRCGVRMLPTGVRARRFFKGRWQGKQLEKNSLKRGVPGHAPFKTVFFELLTLPAAFEKPSCPDSRREHPDAAARSPADDHEHASAHAHSNG